MTDHPVSDIPPPPIRPPDLAAMTPEAMRAQLAHSPEAAAALLRAGAQAGLADAQALYGQVLLDGNGVKSDPVEALRWFLRAAHAGHPMAMNMAGRCYDKGWGAPVDKVAAAQWFKAATKAGLDWGMYNYASALGLGAGVAQDEPAALRWFETAAALGHAKSINFVGAFFEEGRIVPRDLAKARDCYQQAAEGGDFRGQFNLARLLADAGQMKEALDWLARATATAPASFQAIMLRYLDAAPPPALREAADSLRTAQP